MSDTEPKTITGNTRLYGILADPIYHVKTPQRLNAYFAQIGHDGVCVPIHVKPEGLAAVVAGLRQMENLGGVIVTMPHKAEVLALCDEASEVTRQIGAANVLSRGPDGRLTAHMLDGEGFVRGRGTWTGFLLIAQAWPASRNEVGSSDAGPWHARRRSSHRAGAGGGACGRAWRCQRPGGAGKSRPYRVAMATGPQESISGRETKARSAPDGPGFRTKRLDRQSGAAPRPLTAGGS